MTLALAPAEAVLEAALAGGWTLEPGSAPVEYEPGDLVEVLPADLFARAGVEVRVTYTRAGRVIHTTITRLAGEEVLGREAAAGPDVLPFTVDTLRSQP